MAEGAMDILASKGFPSLKKGQYCAMAELFASEWPVGDPPIMAHPKKNGTADDAGVGDGDFVDGGCLVREVIRDNEPPVHILLPRHDKKQGKERKKKSVQNAGQHPTISR